MTDLGGTVSEPHKSLSVTWASGYGWHTIPTLLRVVHRQDQTWERCGAREQATNANLRASWWNLRHFVWNLSFFPLTKESSEWSLWVPKGPSDLLGAHHRNKSPPVLTQQTNVEAIVSTGVSALSTSVQAQKVRLRSQGSLHQASLGSTGLPTYAGYTSCLRMALENQNQVAHDSFFPLAIFTLSQRAQRTRALSKMIPRHSASSGSTGQAIFCPQI